MTPNIKSRLVLSALSALGALIILGASFALTLSPGDEAVISGCTTGLELSGNVLRCVTASSTPTATATATITRTPAPPTATPTATATAPVLASTWFSFAPGHVDAMSHQIARTVNDRLYVGTWSQYQNTIRIWRANGLPNSAADFTRIANITETANPLALDLAYDGVNTLYVLAVLQNGQIRQYTINVTTDSVSAGRTLATDGGTVPSGSYQGSGGIAATWAGGLHIVYRTNANTIKHLPSGTAWGSGAQHPAIAPAPDGSLTAIWLQTDRTIRARTLTGGVWGAIEQVSNVPVFTDTNFGLSIDQSPSVYISPDNVRHVVYIENWRISAPYDYGRVHYATKNGGAWTSAYAGFYTHDPVITADQGGTLRIVGHGYALNSGCTDANDMCYWRRNGAGWAAPIVFADAPAGVSFDSSPSVKPQAGQVELIFFDEAADLLYYGRMP